MKAKAYSLFDDNRGVSPVIGVILMVAITVILAAVIGTFVLGLGGDVQQTPQAQLSVEVGDAGSNVIITHNGGDALTAGDLRVVLTGASTDDDGFNAVTTHSSSEFSVGDTATVSGTTGSGQYTVQVIHTPSESIIVENTVTTS